MVSSVSVFALRFALAANDLVGYVITIEETARKRKCRLAFDSIAPRYAAGAFSSEVETGSRQEHASNKNLEPRSDYI
jgi:hypothetical protein